MKAAVVVEPGRLEILDVPEPRMGDYQVLVEQLACGVCTGTDSKVIAGHFKGFDTYPAVLGHEAVGRVIERGKHVRYFQPGDLVLRPGLEQIGDGSVHSGWGAFARYGVAGDWRAMHEDGRARPEAGYLDVYLSQQTVPASLAPAHAAMLITYKEVLSSAYRFGFRSNASILIYGLGPVGLTFVRFAKILGLGPILAADRHPNRRALALGLGADGCCDPTEESPEAWVKRRVPGGLDFVVDAVGVSDLANRAMKGPAGQVHDRDEVRHRAPSRRLVRRHQRQARVRARAVRGIARAPRHRLHLTTHGPASAGIVPAFRLRREGLVGRQRRDLPARARL